MPRETLIRRYGFSECEYQRDRIYTLLSLASDCYDGRGLQPDYTYSMIDLYRLVLKFRNAEKDASFSDVLQDMLLPDSSNAERVANLRDLMYGTAIFSIRDGSLSV